MPRVTWQLERSRPVVKIQLVTTASEPTATRTLLADTGAGSFDAIPCPIEWLFVSDVTFDKFASSIDAEELYKAMQSFLKCPRCGRLWCFWDGFAKPPTEYMPIG